MIRMTEMRAFIFKARLRTPSQSLQEKARGISRAELDRKLEELASLRDRLLMDLRRESRRLHKDARVYVEEALQNFQASLDEAIRGLHLQAGQFTA